VTDFELTEHDKTSSLWMRLKAHLEGRLAVARIRNDAVLPEPETSALRGEIKTLKALIKLDAARPILTGED
jgi:hypothetical protein